MGKWGWLPLIGSILGALVLVFGLPSTEGAPQEAVVVAVSVALAIIPYVFARAVSEINAPKNRSVRQAELAHHIAIEISRSRRGEHSYTEQEMTGSTQDVRTTESVTQQEQEAELHQVIEHQLGLEAQQRDRESELQRLRERRREIENIDKPERQ